MTEHYIEEGTIGKGRTIMACVARLWRDRANGAVQVRVVIPSGEGYHSGLGVRLCGKVLGRPVRAIFADAE